MLNDTYARRWPRAAGCTEWVTHFWAMDFFAGRKFDSRFFFFVREAEIGSPGDRRLRSRLEHTGTHDSKVADLLSSGLIGQAVELVEKRHGRGSCRVVELPEAYLRETQERVCSAFLRDEKGTW